MVHEGLELGTAAAALISATAYLAYDNNKHPSQPPVMSTKYYQAGEDYGAGAKKARNFFADPKNITAALIRDYRAVRGKYSFSQLLPIVEDLMQKGEPIDDKKGTTEDLIGILCALPSDSQTRVDLTNKLLDTLWDTLQHPPQSYAGGDVEYRVVGNEPYTPSPENTITFTSPDYPEITLTESVPKPPDGMFQYRTPDGSYNNILEPNLGKAGTPYAKTVRTEKKLSGVKPDAGLLFDLLEARTDSSFKENPAGLSSMLFYHASIIIHDIFRTNRLDMNISDTSSYLDLAPLYGSSLQEQLTVRTMKEGKLKPDTFAEKRLLGQPPGVNIMLVLYNRFHNYAAEMLLKINENGKFTLQDGEGFTPAEKAQALAKQDHDLFNTARLITGGLYINICLHDYLRGITNSHHSNTDWTLDPRVDIDKHFDPEGAPRGIGNQVSVEFNLLYRFHSCISKKDEKWTNDFFSKIFGGKTPEELEKLTHRDMMLGLQRFEESINPDPSKREFDNLKRDPKTGKFNDWEMAQILQSAMDDPAGVFGARMVPKSLRIIEILGILQARKWQVGSLNEFRDFFGLKRHQTFEDINSDPEIAGILERLYTHPDMVEMYPGLMIENFKPHKNPGCGICPTYSVGRAILSDAITLVRSDRFNTIDYNVSSLTAWGMNEVQQDLKTLGGSMLYKLIQRGVPGLFPYNHFGVMQPMFTRKANKAIATEFGTDKLFTMDDAKPPGPRVLLDKYPDVEFVLKKKESFVVPWVKPMNDMFPGKKDYSWYMLSGDGDVNAANRKLAQKVFDKVPGLGKALEKMVADVGGNLLNQHSFKMKEDLHQVDFIRDIAIPLNTQLLADMFYLDMQSDENPKGSLDVATLYKNLLAIRTWGVNNTDPAMAWNRRRWAAEGAKLVTETSTTLIEEVQSEKSGGIGYYLHSLVSGTRAASLKQGSLRSCGHKIVEGFLAEGLSAERTAENLWLTAFGATGVLVASFAEILQYFLAPTRERQGLWGEVQNLVATGNDTRLKAYVREAQRLTTEQGDMRICRQQEKVGEHTITAGSVVIMRLGAAGRDGNVVSDPNGFNPDRTEKPLLFSAGMHECFGRELAITWLTSMVKLAAGCKELRPAPGAMGQIKTIMYNYEKLFLNDSWGYVGYTPSTWKLHFSGKGKGVFTGPYQEMSIENDLNRIYAVMRKKKREAEEAKRRPPVGVAA